MAQPDIKVCFFLGDAKIPGDLVLFQALTTHMRNKRGTAALCGAVGVVKRFHALYPSKT